ncbi:MAG TPA: glycosyltransferase [Candidatus Xenobia bacterium]|jgi:glycosyltransferase involved in cell wall biosynthesis
MRPDVSVVVPVRNGAQTLAACLESLLASRYPAAKREILVVDNGSTDATADILRSFGGRVRVLSEARLGPAAARNCGLRAAGSTLLAMTDADCVVDSGWLEAIVTPLAEVPVGIVGGRIRAQTPCNSIARFGERIHDHEAAISVYRPPYVITMNWASRRDVLERVQYFDEQLQRNEDGDFSYRTDQAGYRLVYQPSAIVYHRNRDTLWKLFREGYLHGYHAVPLLRKHHQFLRRLGHRRIHVQSYRRLWEDALASWRQPGESRYSFVFNLGKKLGKWHGSVRFRYVDL